MPEFPDYEDLQPQVYFEKFYLDPMVCHIRQDGTTVVSRAPLWTALSLEVLVGADPANLRVSDGHIEFCGHVEYKVTGYHVKGRALLLERTRAERPPGVVEAVNEAVARRAD